MATLRNGIGALLVGLAFGSAGFGQTGTLVPQSTGGLKRLPPPPGEPMPPPKAPAEGGTPATDVLTGGPATPPPGTVASPWVGGQPAGGCCGPVGGNGPITYELVTYTGPSLPTAGGILSRRLITGWTVGGSANSLFFNTAGDAAWVLGLGLSYTYNRGQEDKPFDVYNNAPPIRDANGQIIAFLPDQLNEFVVRALHRTSFNYSIGRDWFLDGPGIVGIEAVSNWRFGADVGGRWGTAHVELVPTADRGNFFKKGSVTYGLFSGFHLTRETPIGAAILYGGFRTEVGYDWMNVVPPQGGDLFNVNLFLNAGIRF